MVDDEGSGDEELLVASADDPRAFAAVYQRHAAAVLSYFHRRTACPQTAADLMAETFAEAFSSRHRFTDTGAPARAWLFTIARRQLARYARRERVSDRYRRRLGVDRVELSDADLVAIEDAVDATAWHDVLTAALNRLPVGEAEAVRLRVAEDLPYDEVARRLGCTEGAARVRVCRGMTKLSLFMEGP